MQYAEEEDEGATDLPTECENYVFSGERESRRRTAIQRILGFHELTYGRDIQTTGDTALVPFATLLSYYSQLRPGYSLAEWIEALSLDSQPIDIRRMIQFGVIKGFLRRVYAYPVWLDHPNLQQQQTLATQQRGGVPTAASVATTASGTATPLASAPGASRQAAAAAAATRSRQPLDAPALPKLSTTSAAAAQASSRTSTPLRSAAAAAAARRATEGNPRRPASRLGSDGMAAETDNDDNWGENSATTTTMLLPSVSYPPSLAMMFDGTHHTDEICLKYSCSWRTLELVLRQLGEGGQVGGGGGGDGPLGEDRELGGGEYGDDEVPDVPRRGSAASAWDRAAGGYGDRVVMIHV